MPEAGAQQPPPSEPAMEIPHLHVLRSQIRAVAAATEAEDDPLTERERVLHLELEQLPYNLSATYVAIQQLEHLAFAILTAYRPSVLPQQTVGMMLPPEHALAFTGVVDQFLDAARRAQNSLTRYISRTFRTSLPASLSDLMKSKPSAKVPEAVYSLLRGYWQAHGGSLKGYRDLAQHYAIVSSDVYVNVTPSGAMGLHLLLPADPHERSLAKLSYGPPYVHALTYGRRSFLELFSMAYRLTFLLLRYLGYSSTVTAMIMRHPIAVQAHDAFVGAVNEPIDQALWQARRASRDFMDSEFGKLDEPSLPVPKRTRPEA